MDVRKNKIPTSIITRNMSEFSTQTGNVYETVSLLIKRANQISVQMKQELHKKIEDFASMNDGLEEVFENREQIEIVKYYEQLPKATLISIQEYLNGDLYFRNPSKENEETTEEKEPLL